MLSTPKADECFKMIESISLYLNIFYRNLCEGFNSSISTPKESFAREIYWVKYIYLINKYRFLPTCNVTIPNREINDFKNASQEQREGFLRGLIKREKLGEQDRDMFWDVFIKFNCYSISELKDEFWGITQDYKGIKDTYKILQIKYNEIIKQVPDKKCFDYYKLRDDARVKEWLSKLLESKITTPKEFDLMLFNISQTSDDLIMKLSHIINTYKDLIKPQQKADLTLILDNPKAKDYLQAGINAGLMGADYQWLKTKELAAYFASKISDALNMSKAQSGGKKYICWKPFELLWNYPKDSMRKNWNDYQKTGQPPRGYDIIDKIFK